MDNLSLREAVKHFDVSRPTLQKALKSGKISGVQDGQGYWTIDPAELARVYRPRQQALDKDDSFDPAKFARTNTPSLDDIEDLKARLSSAEQRAAVAEALAQERADRIADLRRMLPSPELPKKLQWWPWRR